MVSISPYTALWFTLSALIPASLPVSTMALAAFFVWLLILVMFVECGTKSIRVAATWMVPISLPLLVVHGIVNPIFPATEYLAGVLPIRQDGVIYALGLSLRLGLFTLGLSIWQTVTRDQAFSAFVGWRILPQSLPVILMQSISILWLVSRRAEAILLAQQARGIPVRGGFWSRARSLPTVIVPLVASTLIDSDARATALISRGLGSGPMIVRRSEPMRLSIADIGFLCGLAIADAVVVVLAILR